MQDTTFSDLSYESFRNSFLKLSIQEQAGFFLWPSIASYSLTQQEKELLSTIKPSGVVLFKRSFSDIEQSKKLIEEISAACVKKNTLFENNFIVSADEEGGRVSRLPLGVKTKPVLEFTTHQDKEGLRNQVLLQTHVCQEIGINCILTPVLDIFTEPENKVIGDRSFGHTPEEVCEYAEVVFNTLEEEHIFSCAKHFPGHGNTKADSHVDFATSNATKDILEKREWIPFVYFIQKNIPMIMAAHVLLPNLPGEPDIPATLNYHILTLILREELDFKGLILSDDLRMGAIRKFYESKGIKDDYLAYACIDALKAGCDILLSCNSIVEEKIIIDSIADKLQNEIDFFDLCCEKAYRQTLLFFSHFRESV